MHRFLVLTLALVVAAAAPASGQGRRAGQKAAPAPPPPPIKGVPEMTCPTPLGVGVRTRLAFCDILTGRDPAAGMLIVLPPHTGPVTLTFDLHNRHTYSEEQIKTNRAFARYTATVGVLTMDNTLISRAVVQNEFRKPADLIDRIGGGAGPGGVKAVAPTGSESIVITLPEGETQVSILGEKLTYERADGAATYTSPGRPIAIVSNLMIEYRPAPPPRQVPAKAPPRKK
ncbi:MAG: hypothetical protein ABI868_24365 [Acidobacteriota bacterium]